MNVFAMPQGVRWRNPHRERYRTIHLRRHRRRLDARPRWLVRASVERSPCGHPPALDNADFTDAQAVASIARIIGGNFRLLHRLFVQIGRILKINGLSVVIDDVVETARSTLVIGAT